MEMFNIGMSRKLKNCLFVFSSVCQWPCHIFLLTPSVLSCEGAFHSIISQFDVV